MHRTTATRRTQQWVHQCEYCSKSYKWKGELRTHVQRNHMEHKERYQCSLCSRNYADRRKLRHHMTVKHQVLDNFKSCQPREQKMVVTYKGGDEEIPSSGYEPQGTLLPPSVTSHSTSHHLQQTVASQPPDMIQPSIVTIPVYHHHPHHHHNPPPQHSLHPHRGMLQPRSSSNSSFILSAGAHTLHQHQHITTCSMRFSCPDRVSLLHGEKVTPS
nr:telomere zinc finger-associated protein-like [Cherax quadricarinatus]